MVRCSLHRWLKKCRVIEANWYAGSLIVEVINPKREQRWVKFDHQGKLDIVQPDQVVLDEFGERYIELNGAVIRSAFIYDDIHYLSLMTKKEKWYLRLRTKRGRLLIEPMGEEDFRERWMAERLEG